MSSLRAPWQNDKIKKQIRKTTQKQHKSKLRLRKMPNIQLVQVLSVSQRYSLEKQRKFKNTPKCVTTEIKVRPL